MIHTVGCAWVEGLRTGGPLAVRILARIYAVGAELEGILNRLLISGPQVRSLHGPPYQTSFEPFATLIENGSVVGKGVVFSLPSF